jgi:hypothetical protein
MAKTARKLVEHNKVGKQYVAVPGHRRRRGSRRLQQLGLAGMPCATQVAQAAAGARGVVKHPACLDCLF